MLALIVAVISLSSIDPDPIVTPAPQMHDRITAASGFAPGAPVPSTGFTSDITVAPACTYGVPQFGTSFWNDAASLARLSQPACEGIGQGVPWLPAFGSGFTGLGSAMLPPGARGWTTASHGAPLPTRFTALPAPLSHGENAPVLRVRGGGEPAFARMPVATPHITERRH